MKRTNLLLIVFLFTFHVSFVWAQDSLITLKSKRIYIDNIGNIYTVDDGVITKYFLNKQVKTFSIKTFGTLTSIDVTNALRIILYFKDFQRVLFLDSQLSQNGDVIELTNLNLEQSSLICSSFNNGFWVYNQSNNELVRFNQNLEISVKSGNIKRILNLDIHPNFMVEHNGRLYLNSPDIGILVFDIYGAYLKTIPLVSLSDFQIHFPYIFYAQSGKYYSFNLNTFEAVKIADYSDDCTNIIFNGKYCYWHCNDHIKINNCIK